MLKGFFSNTREKGQHFEVIAEQYLVKQGLKPVTRNYLCRFGEIDLIMKDLNTWVFVEVKYRKATTYGGAINALSVKKQQCLRRSIYQYTQDFALHNPALRVDFVAIQGSSPHAIQWIKNVF
ncbi:YraN family protein [Pseudoalteromonas luteoviolacea]|uniref:UPF0102 protein N475_16730 n=1 Tax=Pseudoalteromonas luteoviolacea DSM 6061 TaxID=1365250 RepID=A0A166WFM0_9GAMM|nr:YraN family protein [Pseudoalteromonas luteoviolacea]KZN37338.1 hypothetical protein N475_16730 [Pseudoalteromonas luteoviolacea DSM 6061]KZN59409.1 hypothetical protein N474_06865 [Pseudoalteromonas luteoviolacea CPMOR-2]MBE0387433.1 putative endonuclease [Pseudoalteromonas luteoviolacea DSM 6061]TQF72244.1 YraN family protein [Pseudoalteromonas luteoviolacea]